MHNSYTNPDANLTSLDFKIILAIFGKAADIMEHATHYGILGEEFPRLQFDVWCSYKLIGDVKCLSTYVEMIGWDHFYALLAQMSYLEWGAEDGILCAYLHYIIKDYIDDDQQDVNLLQTRH
nr:hypothetical protein [Methylorubrum zatmanii]